MVFRVSVSLVLCVLLAADHHNVGVLAGWSHLASRGGGGSSSRNGSENSTDQDVSNGQDYTEASNLALKIAGGVIPGVLAAIGITALIIWCISKKPNGQDQVPTQQDQVSPDDSPDRQLPGQVSPPNAPALDGEQHELDNLNVPELASFEPLLDNSDDVSETSM